MTFSSGASSGSMCATSLWTTTLRQMRRVDIAEVDRVWVERTANEAGFWKHDCKVVPGKSTCLLSAYELHRAGGGSLADLQAARQEAPPVGQAWASGLERLLTEVCRAASPLQHPRPPITHCT